MKVKYKSDVFALRMALYIYKINDNNQVSIKYNTSILFIYLLLYNNIWLDYDLICLTVA